MTSWTLADARTAAQARRRGPGEAVRLPAYVPAEEEARDQVAKDTIPEAAPSELWLDATDADGEVASWFDDGWWTEVITRWGDDPLSIHISPTPAALLHPVVLYGVEMVRRVAPRWRIVGHAFAEEVCLDATTEAIARSPYHEVRFIDTPRPDTPPAVRLDPPFPVEELMSRVRRAQMAARRTWPILVRVASDARLPDATPVPPRARADSTMPST